MSVKGKSLSLEKLISALLSEEKIDLNVISTVLKEHPIEESDLLPWVDYDYPQYENYGRQVIHSGGCFDMLVMSWRPGDYSAIHNHGYAQWGAVIPFGHAHNNLFKFSDNQLQMVEQQLLTPKIPVFVTNDMIHQMGNPSGKNYFSLHIYGCPAHDSMITADAFIYEPEKKRVIETTGGAFLDLPQERVQRIVSEMTTERQTFAYQAGLMINHYSRQKQTDEIKEKTRQLTEKLALHFDH